MVIFLGTSNNAGRSILDIFFNTLTPESDTTQFYLSTGGRPRTPEGSMGKKTKILRQQELTAYYVAFRFSLQLSFHTS